MNYEFKQLTILKDLESRNRLANKSKKTTKKDLEKVVLTTVTAALFILYLI